MIVVDVAVAAATAAAVVVVVVVASVAAATVAVQTVFQKYCRQSSFATKKKTFCLLHELSIYNQIPQKFFTLLRLISAFLLH